jgi:glucokinase
VSGDTVNEDGLDGKMRSTDMRVGLDIGATKILGVVIDGDHAVVARSRQDTKPGEEGILDTVARVLDSAAR